MQRTGGCLVSSSMSLHFIFRSFCETMPLTDPYLWLCMLQPTILAVQGLQGIHLSISPVLRLYGCTTTLGFLHRCWGAELPPLYNKHITKPSPWTPNRALLLCEEERGQTLAKHLFCLSQLLCWKGKAEQLTVQPQACFLWFSLANHPSYFPLTNSNVWGRHF